MRLLRNRRMEVAKVAAAESADETCTDDGALERLAALAEAEAAEAHARAELARARATAARLRSAVTHASHVDHTAAAPPVDADGELSTPSPRPGDGTDCDTDDHEDDPPPAPSPNPVPLWRRRPRWGRVALVATVLATCGLLALTGVMLWQHRGVEARRQRDAAFVAAASRDVEALLSIDYTKAREGVQRVIDSSTGKFRDDFAKNAGDFIKGAEQAKAVSQVTVSAAALQMVSSDSATVLVSVASRVSNANGANQDTRAWRMSVTMDRDGNQMKMSNVEFVP